MVKHNFGRPPPPWDICTFCNRRQTWDKLGREELVHETSVSDLKEVKEEEEEVCILLRICWLKILTREGIMYLSLVIWYMLSIVIGREIEMQEPYSSIGASNSSLDEFDGDKTWGHEPGASDTQLLFPDQPTGKPMLPEITSDAPDYQTEQTSKPVIPGKTSTDLSPKIPNAPGQTTHPSDQSSDNPTLLGRFISTIQSTYALENSNGTSTIPDSSSDNQICPNEKNLNENLPVRSFMDDPNIKWKYGVPDYSLADAKYMAEKTMNHPAGSLEKTVENLVKTWEMESEYKAYVNDWGSVVPDEYHIAVNGHFIFDISDAIEIGNYNILLMDSPLYNARNETRSSSRKTFKTAFPGAFAWEVLEVLSGPPKVAFTWHHWADWTGPYTNVSSTGERMDLYGSCIATVTDEMKITDLQVFYDSCPFMAKLNGMETESGCPFI